MSACGKASLEDSGKGQIYYDKELAGVQLVITKTENGTIWYKLNCREEAAQLMTGNSQDAILEQWTGSEWRQLKVKSGFAWTMEAHVVTPESPFEGSLAVAGKYGNLRPGRYRLIKAFSAAGVNYSAKAEFEWKK